MSRYREAAWLPLPENTTQPHIIPTQLILHSAAAPWSPKRLRDFWNERGVTTESHFGVGYDGAVGQFMDTHVRADANASANNRAISVESAADTRNSDPWTPDQIDTLVEIMVWAHREHGIPARICRSETDPGFGVHRMFRKWSLDGTECPGKARAEQFTGTVFPRFLETLGGVLEPVVPTVELENLQYGKTNGDVVDLQKALIEHGGKIPAGATGYYGDQTRAAIAAFQRKQGWTGPAADGIPGVETCKRLNLRVA
ncbi:peptidoglycan recognition protein family protein [Streptomyces viridosporus]|uniref:peptidoglycan recognition protein family protein n=1 Tax=Streptomyces viridosporus TaxID=67581 RepID=UPI000364DE1E|nr:peptidoglycan-binding protein [Streptomyces viridosporus]